MRPRHHAQGGRGRPTQPRVRAGGRPTLHHPTPCSRLAPHVHPTPWLGPRSHAEPTCLGTGACPRQRGEAPRVATAPALTNGGADDVHLGRDNFSDLEVPRESSFRGNIPYAGWAQPTSPETKHSRKWIEPIPTHLDPWTKHVLTSLAKPPYFRLLLLRN